MTARRSTDDSEHFAINADGKSKRRHKQPNRRKREREAGRKRSRGQPML